MTMRAPIVHRRDGATAGPARQRTEGSLPWPNGALTVAGAPPERAARSKRMYAASGYDQRMLDFQPEPPGQPQEVETAAGGAAPARLDEAQRRAVEHGDGPCLVLAGPGSGKTRVIVERFLRLLHAGTPPERLLVLTYTRKAAAEMRDRVERVHGPFEGEPPLLNYHSFAQRVLRRWGWRLGISPAFRIADDAERWLVVDRILAELRPTTLYNPLRSHDLVDAILDLIEKAKQELVSPEAYADWAEARLAGATGGLERELLIRHRECAAVYRRLEAIFVERAVLDHDDTILFAERLLREHDDVREAVAGAIDHVMVDEYQDTNYAQARLVEALAGERGNILVVADDDQSIYKFRGASLANLDRFARIYPRHERVILDRNYRSHQEIVEASRAIIGAAPPGSRIEKHLVADRGTGGTVQVWRAADERGEVVEVARECRRLLGGRDRPDRHRLALPPPRRHAGGHPRPPGGGGRVRGPRRPGLLPAARDQRPAGPARRCSRPGRLPGAAPLPAPGLLLDEQRGPARPRPGGP